jgi:hypothetical protein
MVKQSVLNLVLTLSRGQLIRASNNERRLIAATVNARKSANNHVIQFMPAKKAPAKKATVKKAPEKKVAPKKPSAKKAK